MELTTEEMIEALTKSGNELIASKCFKIKNGTLTINEAKKYAGGFLFAVLNGNYQEAVDRADKENKLCLLIASRKKELTH
jgi:hypothetical protein